MNTFAGIDTSFAVKNTRGEQKYPAIQATTYQPRSLGEKVELCLSETSLGLIDPEQGLETTVIECAFKKDVVLMHQIVSPVRWVFLGLPLIFTQHKKTKEIAYPKKGEKLAEAGKVTIAKCFLACLHGDRLILNSEGLPQVFTLKLTSNKTKLVGYPNDPTGTKSLLSLDEKARKANNSSDSLLHLLSVDLGVKANEFTSRMSGESSLGIEFVMEGDAMVLSRLIQKQIFELINKEEFKKELKNPFGLSSRRDTVTEEDGLGSESAPNYVSNDEYDF